MMKTIIYIAGYGRSGSTLLDIILSQSKYIKSTGALSNFSEWVLNDRKCACGESLSECVVWSSIIHKFCDRHGESAIEQYELLRKRYESRSSFWKGIFVSPFGRDYNIYTKYTKSLYDLIFNEFDTAVLVDSSKSSTDSVLRAYNLSKIDEFDVKYIMLVRDPRGCIYSVINGKGSPERVRKKYPKFIWALRAVNGWLQANFYANYSMSQLQKDNVIMVSYEEFISDPLNTIGRLSEFTGVDLSDVNSVIANGKDIVPGHNLGGNRLRFSKHIKLRLDERWKEELSFFYRYILSVPCVLYAKKLKSNILK
jgi:hypothetical protein